jgi:hypothetical protein
MEALLPKFELSPTTWVYITSIALVGFFFKFNRLMSVRNLDLAALIALGPGLLIVSHGRTTQDQAREAIVQAQGASEAVAAAQEALSRGDTIESSGFFLLLGVGLFFLGRLIADVFMTRRPLLEPNLSQGGLTWIGFALLLFLVAAILTTHYPGVAPVAAGQLKFAVLDLFPVIPSRTFNWVPTEPSPTINDLATRILCALGHLAVVAGLIYVGQRHFDNLWTGVGMAVLYLMLPYTAQFAGHVKHVVPAALLVWMIALYRHPLAAGSLLGACVGLIYYPAFLIPLWASFYSRRGWLRFFAGLGCSLTVIVVWVALYGELRFWEHYKDMFNPFRGAGEGLWLHWHSATRLPISVLFCCFAIGMAIWPARKSLGTLLACSAAVMLSTQFWYPDGGLLMMNWYLPLLLLTIYRPNLEHRVATTTVAVRSVRRRAPAPAVKDLPA